MLDFLLNLVNAGDQSSVLIAGQEIQYPEYFTTTKEFKSGN